MNEMHMYIGVKLINAKPMRRSDFERLMAKDVFTEDEDGYLVEYLDSDKPNHPDYKNYISWSPKNVFENAYRTTDGLTFGLAIEATRLQKKVTRENPDIYSMIVTGDYLMINKHGQLRHIRNEHGHVCQFFQEDILATDWMIIDDTQSTE